MHEDLTSVLYSFVRSSLQVNGKLRFTFISTATQLVIKEMETVALLIACAKCSSEFVYDLVTTI